MVTNSAKAPRAIESDPMPPRRWVVSALRALGRPLPDGLYLRLAHWLFFRRWPDYQRPATIQEAIQGYMLRTRDPALVWVADKLLVRAYIERTVGPGHTVPVAGVWRDAAAVDFARLPYPVVLKPTHLSGRTMFLERREPARETERRARLADWLRRRHSHVNREWFYAHVQPGLVAEPMLLDENGEVPADVKVHVYNGAVRYIQVDRGRFGRHTRTLYDEHWNLLPARTSWPRHGPERAPERLAEMIELSMRLAAPFEFMRVDWYVLGERLLVGELTSTPGAGIGRFFPMSFSRRIAAQWSPGPPPPRPTDPAKFCGKVSVREVAGAIVVGGGHA